MSVHIMRTPEGMQLRAGWDQPLQQFFVDLYLHAGDVASVNVEGLYHSMDDPTFRPAHTLVAVNRAILALGYEPPKGLLTALQEDRDRGAMNNVRDWPDVVGGALHPNFAAKLDTLRDEAVAYVRERNRLTMQYGERFDRTAGGWSATVTGLVGGKPSQVVHQSPFPDRKHAERGWAQAVRKLLGPSLYP